MQNRQGKTRGGRLRWLIQYAGNCMHGAARNGLPHGNFQYRMVKLIRMLVRLEKC
jgi:hypothetical protein